MRYGFTTGSCAAAAAKASSEMLLGKTQSDKVSILTPAGIVYDALVEDVSRTKDCVSCAVRKDAGDDPDVTGGTLVYAEVSVINDGLGRVVIEGGRGVGTVTRPGLDQPVGNAAINSVPRQMITSCVREIMESYGCENSVRVVISVPEGEELAARTFNPRLGVTGGISIIGTTGIVEPMSTRALLDTIRVELKQIREEGADIAVVSPGNYGLDFMREYFGYDLDRAVKCSNYIGETIDMAGELGFSDLILVGHVGKLIKVSGGIMNTHSHEADCRMELMAAACVKCGAPYETVSRILDCVTTEEAYKYMVDAGIEKNCFEYIMDRIAFYMNNRAGGKLHTECIVYANAYGLLGATAEAVEMMEKVVSGGQSGYSKGNT